LANDAVWCCIVIGRHGSQFSP